MKCSLVLSTYNWPEALELVLLSLLNQSLLPNEVIIADDGSSHSTKDLIDRFRIKFPVSIIHVSHEDQGFRKSMIMNKAIAQASNPYIIQIDGDIIMHKHFIKDHLSMAAKGTYLYGSRVNITKSHLENLFKNKQISFNYFSKGIKKRNRTLRIPLLAGLNKKVTEISSKTRGCNISFWKDDFIKVNGYNEEFRFWGNEDSEMVIRLHHIGIQGKRIKHKGIVYHIYHKEQDKSHAVKFKDVVNETITQKKTYIKKGIDQYL